MSQGRLHSRKETPSCLRGLGLLRKGTERRSSFLYGSLGRNFPMTMRCLSVVDRVISRILIFRNWGGCTLFEFERTIP